MATHPGAKSDPVFPLETNDAGHPSHEPRDPLLAEKLLSNLGYQGNLAGRVRQDLNLFSQLVPGLQLFSAGQRLDVQYLAVGITNTPLFAALLAVVHRHADSGDLRHTNEFVKSPLPRLFVIEYWSSVYDVDNFVAFMSKPFDGSDWRRDALQALNRLWYLDSIQAVTLRHLAPLLLGRLRLTPASPGVAPIESTAASLAFYRTAWAARSLSDEDLYALIAQSGHPAVARALAVIAGALGAVIQDLAKAMDTALPADLSGLTRRPLDALTKSLS